MFSFIKKKKTRKGSVIRKKMTKWANTIVEIVGQFVRDLQNGQSVNDPNDFFKIF